MDGEAADAPMTPDPFDGAPPYVAMTGTATHQAGASCMQPTCHGSAGAEGPPFFIAGTVFVDPSASTPAPGVEVRIMDSNGNATSTYTGPTGTFYISSSAVAAGFAFPAAVGARNATVSRLMMGHIASSAQGSCTQSACHLTGGDASPATAPIHVP